MCVCCGVQCCIITHKKTPICLICNTQMEQIVWLALVVLTFVDGAQSWCFSDRKWAGTFQWTLSGPSKHDILRCIHLKRKTKVNILYFFGNAVFVVLTNINHIKLHHWKFSWAIRTWHFLVCFFSPWGLQLQLPSMPWKPLGWRSGT